jgi:DNA-binding response OmpR family regulator
MTGEEGRRPSRSNSLKRGLNEEDPEDMSDRTGKHTVQGDWKGAWEGAPQAPPPRPAAPAVLIVDDDHDLAELVRMVLDDEGFAVTNLHDLTVDAVRAAVGRLEPDCVLLDGQSPLDYGASWAIAAWLHQRERPIPVVMFTGHDLSRDEAEGQDSARSQAAAFAGILPKPFELDELLAVVRRAVGQSTPFDRSPAADAARTGALLARLAAIGAQEIRPSSRREAATFRVPGGAVVQLYWAQREGAYYVVRAPREGGPLEPVGRAFDLDTAITLALAPRVAGGTGAR